MGYEVDLFENKEAISDELMCSICINVLEKPVMLDKCQHMFCGTCIHGWHKTSKTCPIDRQKIVRLKLKPAPRPILNMLNELRRKCQECEEIITIGGTNAHENVCRRKCAKECGAVLIKAELPNHDCIIYLKDLAKSLLVQNSELKEEIIKGNEKIGELENEVDRQERKIDSMEAGVELLKFDLEQAKKGVFRAPATINRKANQSMNLQTPPPRMSAARLSSSNGTPGTPGPSPMPQGAPKRRRGS